MSTHLIDIVGKRGGTFRSRTGEFFPLNRSVDSLVWSASSSDSKPSTALSVNNVPSTLRPCLNVGAVSIFDGGKHELGSQTNLWSFLQKNCSPQSAAVVEAFTE